jgi:hypothetical protein
MENIITPELLKWGDKALLLLVIYGAYKLVRLWLDHQIRHQNEMLKTMLEGFARLTMLMGEVHGEVRELHEWLKRKNGKT